MAVVFLMSTLASALVLPPATRSSVVLSATEGPVKYLSSLEKKEWQEGQENAPSDPRARVQTTESVNAGPANYDGFVDASDGFDGGDGQVGVVGDGTNAMEEWDMSESVRQRRQNAVGGSESKQTRANVWGYSTGYADELAKQGMVDIDEYGEDRLMAKRQQLENWRNQREVRLQKESQIRDLHELQGKEYVPARQGEYLNSMGGAKASPMAGFGRHAAASKSAAVQLALTPKPERDGALQLTARLNSNGGTTVVIHNEYSVYSDFKAGFAPGSAPEITVEPQTGTLNRRGGAPQEFVIKFKPSQFKPEGYAATFVVQTEDHCWAYDITATAV